VPPIKETSLPGGKVARTGPDGSLRELQSPSNNMSIHYGMSGSRRIRVDQADGSRIVLASRGVPYVQKPWNFRGQAFDHRTYVDNGVLRDQFYRQYTFGGSTLDAYAPQRFYSQDFYKWAAKPQSWTPLAWSDQMKQQLFTPYQAYFTPQSSYPSPVLWLTDFVLAMSLFEAHNAHPLPAQAPPSVPGTSTPQSSAPQTPSASAPVLQAPIAPTPTSPAVVPPPTPVPPVLQPPVVPIKPDDQGPSLGIWERFTNYIRGLFGQTPAETAALPPEPPPLASGAAPITDDVKDKVTDEVRAQIAQEAREADASARNLDPKPGAGGVVEELATRAQHVFVVASDLDLVDDTGRRCMMSEGDVVQILSAADAESGTAPGIVLSSKGGVECTQSAKVDIALDDLQEMQNHMRATIDEGLKNTPRGGIENPVIPAFAGAAPPADANAKSEIEKQKTIAASLESGS